MKNPWFLLCLFLLTTAALPLMLPPPGLSSPEPVGAFLNNAFPTLAPTNDTELLPAYPNITFNSPLTWTMDPHRDTVFVGQRDGKIYWFDNDQNVSSKQLFMDISNQVGVVWDGGFLGMAMHPNFGVSGATGSNYFYTYYATKDSNGGNEPTSPLPQQCPEQAIWHGNYLILSRFEVANGTLNVMPNSETVMFKVRLYNSTHRGGGLLFGQDGYLYLTTGDQAQHSTAQTLDNNFDGGVFRIDVDKNPATSHAPPRVMPQDARAPDEISGVEYWIPNDNPFVGTPGIFEEYFTVGHRNPHRMTMDPVDGKIYIGEVGSSTHEEINVVETGKNYGWPIWEGSVPKNVCTNQMYDNMAHTTPLLAFPRSAANSIIGGYVYRGSNVPSLYGKYICGDYGSGEEIWSVNTQTGDYELLFTFTPGNVISFGQDHDGEIYLMKQGNNTILYTIGNSGAQSSIPSTLSATGAFSDLTSLSPAQGLVPYDLVESFWSDKAEKQRWMVIPNDGTHNSNAEQIAYSEEGEWDFPVGTVLIKHFELPIDESDPSITRRLETRFSIKATDGQFYFLTYKWRADGSDADLLTTGLDEDYTITTSTGTRLQTWHYPNQAECLTCHSDALGGTLGPRTRYLNKDFLYPSSGVTANQLVTLSHLGIIDQTILDSDVGGLLTSAAQDDPTTSLEHRARSYLDLNCGYCHRPSTGNRAVFDARLTTPIEFSGYFTQQLNESIGLPEEWVIKPADTAVSVLYQRIHSIDPTIMMPPLAKNEIDENGAALIAEWIMNMDPSTASCTPTNLAPGSLVSQSSTYVGSYNFDPENAIDGNTNGDDAGNSLTHTNNEANAWWHIDLGQSQQLTGIKLWNRSDCCSDRLSNFYVLVSDVPFTSTDLTTSLNQPGVTSVHFPGIASRETYMDISSTGQYIRIQLAGTGILTLAEVEVLGCSPASNCTASGQILMERWDNIGGGVEVSLIPTNTNPSSTSMLNLFEIPVNTGDNFGARVRGYICPPVSGNYEFWISSDDNGELWLSTDDDPANISRIAHVPGWTSSREWDKYPQQQSVPVSLIAGQRYYVEALIKEQAGGDNLAIGWTLPNGNIERPIPGNFLSPWSDMQDQTISFGPISDKLTTDQAFSLSATASSGLPVSFVVESGPASMSGNTLTLTGSAGTVIVRAEQAGDSQYNPAPPVSQSFDVSDPTSSCTASGQILMERWNYIGGGVEVSLIPTNTAPSSTSMQTLFEMPVNTGNNYGVRMRGYICPPVSGTYEFWISSDDNGELWLSTDDSPANISRVAHVPGWTTSREWNKYPEQQSTPIALIAGQRYYVEALVKEQTGGDNLAVGWTMPDGSLDRPIAGSFLSPWSDNPTMQDQTISFGPISDKLTTDQAFSLTATASSGLPVSFVIESGPASMSGNTLTLAGSAGTVVVRAEQAGDSQYNPASPVSQSFAVSEPSSGSCTASGQILLERWNYLVGGVEVSLIPTHTNPSTSSLLNLFEMPVNTGNNYGARIRGYICPPVTGNYEFWISSDDNGELWISTDDSPANISRIAHVPDWTSSREWNKYPEQQSIPIALVAGQRYYVEALVKEQTGGDNLAVGWTLPGGSLERPIAGTHLSPWTDAQAQNQTISFGPLSNKLTTDPAFSLTATASSGLPVSFVIESGPASMSGNTLTLTGSAGTVVVRAEQAGNAQYDPASPVSQSFTVSDPNNSSCTASGQILMERWNYLVGGVEVSLIPTHTNPSTTSMRNLFEIPVNTGNNYGARMRGYICPPVTGNYEFWISSDDNGELWLSTDENPANISLIAHVPDWTSSREWNKFPVQQSVPIALVAGQRYYVEALVKERTGGDNLAVGWTLPDGSLERPITGAHLSPWSASSARQAGQLSDQSSDMNIRVFPNPLDKRKVVNVVLDLPMAESVIVRLFSADGKQILRHEERQEKMSHTFTLAVPELANGIYFLRIEGKSWQKTERLIVSD